MILVSRTKSLPVTGSWTWTRIWQYVLSIVLYHHFNFLFLHKLSMELNIYLIRKAFRSLSSFQT